MRNMQVGDLTCPGLDTDKFKSECRIPLFVDKWNLWRVVYASDQKADIPEITKSVNDWFDSQVFPTQHRDYDNLSVSGAPPRDNSLTLVKRIQDCLPWTVSMRGKVLTEAWVRFVYRGSKTTFEWPMYQEAFTLNANCPIDVTWLCTEVYSAPQDMAVPKDPSDILPDFPSLNPTKSVSGALIALGIGVGVVGLVWLNKR